MNNFQKQRIAFIGLGDIAQKAYLPIVANHSKITPILCTRNNDVLNELANKYRINEVYTDIDTLIEHKPAAAMIHSATESHFALVSTFLKAGIPVFVDKPLCYTIEEVEELLNIATQNKVLLYLGFNRRFAPLVSNLKKEQNPIQIFWQKNRVNLPAAPRVFIFDDFIHVIDSLRFLGKGAVKDLQVFSTVKNGLLENIKVQWQQNGTLLSGAMNRVSGRSEERIEYYTKGNKWQIEELVSGTHYKDEKQAPIGFNNWDSTLYKRGFVDLIEDWLDTLQEDSFNTNRIEDIRKTHRLCEMIVQKIS
jgi:virulence factor